MPSSKVPTSLVIGPGRLSANVASASAFTAVPANPVDTGGDGISVVSVASTTTLTRQGPQMIVLVTAGGGYEITLPSDAEVGDVVTFVRTTTGSSSTHVTITAVGLAVNGGFEPETFAGSYAARTFVRTTSTWVGSLEKPSVRPVSSATSLSRAGYEQIVLVDTTSGDITITTPARVQVGDRITVIKTSSDGNSVNVDGSGSDTIDGRTNIQILSQFAAVTLVAVSSSSWITLSETDSVISVTNSMNLGSTSQTSAKRITLLVRTLDSAWIGGSKTITLPSTLALPGTVVTITDVDGAAATNPIIVSSLIGFTAPGGVPSTPSDYTMETNYASISIVRTPTAWVIAADSPGLVDNFMTLARTSIRSDGPLTRMTVNPMYNWSHRKVAIHAEFTGLITNILPVEGFSGAGSIVLSSVSGVPGTVGVMRCTVPAGSSGYVHLGNLPTTPMFDPAVLFGFRAILAPQTANPGDDYDVIVGFGDDLSDITGTLDQVFGANGLFIGTGTSGVWRRVRKAGGTSAGGDLGAVVAGNRYVIEYYTSAAGSWESYVNGVRNAGGSTNIPTALLNFGMLIRGDGGVVDDYTVDVDSFTVFTRDMGNTRYT